MRTAAALLGLLLSAAPALAQECATQTPPSFGGNMAPVGPCNSLPAGDSTGRTQDLGVLTITRIGPASAPVQAQAAPQPVQRDIYGRPIEQVARVTE